MIHYNISYYIHSRLYSFGSRTRRSADSPVCWQRQDREIQGAHVDLRGCHVVPMIFVCFVSKAGKLLTVFFSVIGW